MNWMLIIHFANLPVALARRDEPALCDLPLIIWARHADLARVVATDAPGVTRGLTLRQARLRCPEAAICQDAPEAIRAAGALLRATLAVCSPRIIALADAPDVALAADLGRVAPARALVESECLRAAIFQALGIMPALALAAQTTIGLLAAQTAAAGDIIIVPPGREAEWLAPRPVELLPLNPIILERLRRFGLSTIGAVAALPSDALEAQFGAIGRVVSDLARGRALPAPPAEQSENWLVIGWRFAGGVNDRAMVDAALGRVAARLARRLQAAGQALRGINLTLVDDAGAPRAVWRTLAEPTSDAVHIAALLVALASPLAVAAIERVIVEAYPTLPRVEQRELFPMATARGAHVQATLDRLAARFAGQLQRARIIAPEARRFEQRVQWETWEAS